MTRTRPLLDLALQWRSPRVFGDITVITTWTLDDDRPCLVLVPTYTPISHERISPSVVRMGSAFQWDTRTGDPAFTADATFRFANAMQFSPTPALLVRIHNIINDCLSDLISMPPAPRHAEGEVVADVIATDTETGKTIHQGEVTDHV